MKSSPPKRPQRPDLRVEKELIRGGCSRLAAMDEVGRGALAGPVTVGVVVVTTRIGRVPAGLRDSKLLTPEARQRLVEPIRRWAAEWAVGHSWPSEVDAYGLMCALRLAAGRALAQLAEPVDAVLLDGNHDYLNAAAQPGLFDVAPPVALPVHLRVKADLRCAGVAAASVLAKTTRDAMMIDYSARHLMYAWAVNKGYATPDHLAAIAAHGPCEQHRRSWRLSGPGSAGSVGSVGEDGGQAADRPVLRGVKGA